METGAFRDTWELTSLGAFRDTWELSSLGAERECFPSKEHRVSKCEQWVRFLEAPGASEESHVGTDLF